MLFWALHVKFGLILVVGVGLNIKLGWNYEILNLGLMSFILIYQILGLVDCVYILVINLKILD